MTDLNHRQWAASNIFRRIYLKHVCHYVSSSVVKFCTGLRQKSADKLCITFYQKENNNICKLCCNLKNIYIFGHIYTHQCFLMLFSP
jgi:hypothetical protein